MTIYLVIAEKDGELSIAETSPDVRPYFSAIRGAIEELKTRDWVYIDENVNQYDLRRLFSKGD